MRISSSSIETSLGFGFSENKSLASLDNFQLDSFGLSANQLEGNLLCLFSLLPENGLGLSTETLLLCFVSPVSLGISSSFSFLVLRDFVDCMLFSGFAVCSNELGIVHLQIPMSIDQRSR